jgi:hypothetical protein
MANIDLRPKKGEPLYEVLRFGMVFDNVDSEGMYTFTRMSDNLFATFKGMDAEEITFTDRTSTNSLTVPMAQVTTASQVVTWQGSNPTLKNA